ncbi:MAG: DUF4199 domain-containing protein [Cyclobacteriaceae bacterium]|nr:DUF4199 domain-containing protein [Cyclobacteriaceae bacterium]
MKKIIIIYGLISGAIVGGLMLGTMAYYQTHEWNLSNGHLIGYATMVIALSLIFVAIKSVRDKYLGGVITFWKGCQIGLLITLIASVMYALSWEVSYRNIGAEFVDKMKSMYVEELKKEKLSEAEFQKEIEKSNAMWESYQNPIIRFGITLMEIFPVGLVLTLISAGLLRKKEFLPPVVPNV